jgi:hypothetical protein
VKHPERETFTRGQVDAFLFVLGASVVACAATDALLGAWSVHAGKLFPWRHLPGVPLYGTTLLAVEWAIGVTAGVALLAPPLRPWRDAAVRLAIVATAMGLSQRFSNHRSLLLIVLVFVALEPLPRPTPGKDATIERPSLALVRAQLLLVYAFSVVNKVAHGFLTGDALTTLFPSLPWSAHRATLFSSFVVAAEVAVPVLLVVRARWGVVLCILLHASMAALLPSVTPFSLTMIAMASLFWR